MSVGDRKGARRRFKALERKGHAPRRTGLSTLQLIEVNRKAAAKAAKVVKKKK